MKKQIKVAIMGDITPKVIEPKKVWFGDKGMKKLAQKIKLNKEQKAIEKAKKIKLTKRIAVVISFILLVALFVGLIDRYVKWSRSNTIVVQSPITITTQRMFEVVSLAELNRRGEVARMRENITEIVEGIILKPNEGKLEELKKTIATVINADEFFEFIWNAETTKGKNGDVGLSGYCRSIGMWNEIGYSPSTKFCFKDEKEARYYVAYYVYKNGKGLNMSELLCFYNEGNDTIGRPRKTCPYSEGNFAEAN